MGRDGSRSVRRRRRTRLSGPAPAPAPSTGDGWPAFSQQVMRNGSHAGGASRRCVAIAERSTASGAKQLSSASAGASIGVNAETSVQLGRLGVVLGR